MTWKSKILCMCAYTYKAIVFSDIKINDMLLLNVSLANGSFMKVYLI